MENDHQQVSRLVDGDLDGRGAEFLLRRIAGDGRLRGAWRRYHLLRACLKGECAGRLDLAERIRGRLSEVEAPETAARGGAFWLRTAAGGALAASVAVLAIFGINQSLLDHAPAPVSASAEAETEAGFVSQSISLDRQFSPRPVPVSLSSSPGAPAAARPDSRQRISSYVLRHNQAAGGSGFISYTPILTANPQTRPVAAEDSAEEDAPPTEPTGSER